MNFNQENIAFEMSIKSRTVAERLYKKIGVIVFLCSFFTCSLYAQTDINVVDLRCENLRNPLAIDNTSPHFSWKIESKEAFQQEAYEIQIASDSIGLHEGRVDVWKSGRMPDSRSVMVSYGNMPLLSRHQYYWRVRVWDREDRVSNWSPIHRFGIGVLEGAPLKGEYIGLAIGKDDVRAPLLRKTFHVQQLSTTLLHVSSLGYHEVYLNGVKIGKDVLAPAVSQLNKRVWVNTYDVTAYLKSGKNELVLWLGQGWYKPTTFGTDYDGPLVKAELGTIRSNQWNTIAVTDETWSGRGSGYRDTGTWRALQFGGERIDARLNPVDLSDKTLNDLDWHPVVVKRIPALKETPQMCEPNRVQEVLQAKSIRQIDADSWLVDFGKVITGWFSWNSNRLPAGHEVTVHYTDDIGFDPNFTEQGEKDIYIASGKTHDFFCNKFNHHAFRYVKISNVPVAPTADQVKAYLVRGDYQQAASFVCSDPEMNAIHDMVQYTMQCLTFSGYMVDCPHLERAGYGGDGNSSTNALQLMYDVSPTFLTWLQSWEDSMREGGSLPHVAPNPGAGGGGPYWCGFLVMAPWRTYVHYGDPRLINRHYEAMKQWLGYVDQYTVDGLLKRWPDLPYRDWYLGDWLAPMGVDAGSQASVDLVNNCFISQCLSVLQKIAITLGEEEDARQYEKRKNALNRLIHHTFYDEKNEIYATGSQLDMCYPMLVGVVPDSLYTSVREKMIKRTAEVYNSHIAVGLVGVPILTQWAVHNKASEFMYGLLKQPDYPGYLHMINNNATTTWESWNGDRSRVHNCYNGVGSWFYESVGGLIYDESKPGYQHVYIDPQPPKGIDWAKVSKETPYGKMAISWERKNNAFVAEITLPPGVEATYVLSEDRKEFRVDNQKGEAGAKQVKLTSGHHKLEILD